MFYICICILTFFAVIGVCSLCRGIMRLSAKNRSGELVLIEPIKGDRTDAEFLLRSAASKAMWLCGRSAGSVCCLDCGMDGETRKICETLCCEYPCMNLCTKEELCRIIENK